MSLKALRRKLDGLEARLAARRNNVPMTPAQRKEILRRAAAGERLSSADVQLIRRHGCLVGPNVRIVVKGESVTINRLLGVDWDAI